MTKIYPKSFAHTESLWASLSHVETVVIYACMYRWPDQCWLVRGTSDYCWRLVIWCTHNPVCETLSRVRNHAESCRGSTCSPVSNCLTVINMFGVMWHPGVVTRCRRKYIGQKLKLPLMHSSLTKLVCSKWLV